MIDLLDDICPHTPSTTNRWCDSCERLIIAGVMLRSGDCEHERLFPPGFEWAPESWCTICETFRPFGRQPLAPRRGIITPAFWQGRFTTTVTRSLNVLELGRALAWPPVTEMHHRLGTGDRTVWYRWRERGIDVATADRLAVNACLHPLEVWGTAWEQAS